jgi:hypothetical protein
MGNYNVMTGGCGGGGGYTKMVLNSNCAGKTLFIIVGQCAQSRHSKPFYAHSPVTYGGGGYHSMLKTINGTNIYDNNWGACSGGGRSAVQLIDDTGNYNEILTAGGGGSAGLNTGGSTPLFGFSHGGVGGGLIGGRGNVGQFGVISCSGGFGGTQTVGGLAGFVVKDNNYGSSGYQFQGGGANESQKYCTGAGGGYYGGGASGWANGNYGGSGGGSGYVNSNYGTLTDISSGLYGSTFFNTSLVGGYNSMPRQNIVTATVLGTINGTTLTVNTVQFGYISVGMLISGNGIKSGIFITAYNSGIGGVGNYTISDSNNISTEQTINLFPNNLSATLTGSITGKVLTVTSFTGVNDINGSVYVGMYIFGSGVIPGTRIIAFNPHNSTGGNNNYVISILNNTTTTSFTALTLNNPPVIIPATLNSGYYNFRLYPGMVITGTGIASNTSITSCPSNTTTYNISINNTVSTPIIIVGSQQNTYFIGDISNNVLTVRTITSGTICIGLYLVGLEIVNNTFISGFITTGTNYGTNYGTGATGIYQISNIYSTGLSSISITGLAGNNARFRITSGISNSLFNYNSDISGIICTGMYLYGSLIPNGCFIRNVTYTSSQCQVSISGLNIVSIPDTIIASSGINSPCVFTGTINNKLLSVTAIGKNSIPVGTVISGCDNTTENPVVMSTYDSVAPISAVNFNAINVSCAPNLLGSVVGTIFASTVNSSPSLIYASISGSTMLVTDLSDSFIYPGMKVYGSGIPNNTFITNTIDAIGSYGSYSISNNISPLIKGNFTVSGFPSQYPYAIFTGYLNKIISSYASDEYYMKITVTSVSFGQIYLGMSISGSGIIPGTTIIGFGTGIGNIGTYYTPGNNYTGDVASSALPITITGWNIGNGTYTMPKYTTSNPLRNGCNGYVVITV